MRFFECFAYPAAYKSRLDQLAIGAQKFSDRLSVFFADRYGASHILLPVDHRDPDAFFTNWDDEKLQRSWAREAGLGDKLSLEVILLAQIENHRAEVFYTIDPVRLGNTFLKRLPGCVKRTVAWRAAPGVSITSAFIHTSHSPV